VTVRMAGFIGVAGVAIAVLLQLSSVAWAGNTAKSLSILAVHEDRFFNYDFRSTRSTANTNVDWPVTMVFYNDATVNKVKNAYWGPVVIGSSMYARMTDNGTSWTWDSDRGTKTGGCGSGQVFRHLRVYAPGDGDRMYNIGWGYYVLGTTHYDREECLKSAKYGWSEDAEHYMYTHARNVLRWTASLDYMSFANSEPARWEGNNFWQSDGKATFVRVP
jgi:hypothetical protein